MTTGTHGHQGGWAPHPHKDRWGRLSHHPHSQVEKLRHRGARDLQSCSYRARREQDPARLWTLCVSQDNPVAVASPVRLPVRRTGPMAPA